MKASDFLFLTALLSLPIQLNKFFWPQFSFVWGIPHDLLAPAVYLSDLAIILYVIVFAGELVSRKTSLGAIKAFYKRQKIFFFSAVAFNFYLFLNALFVSDKPMMSFWFSSKVFEFSLFAILAQLTLSQKRIFNASLAVLAISVFWQAYLMFLQFVAQKSLGLWFLGERSFAVDTPAIAHVYLFGKQLLRPYGTFPHPNVAAAFFAISFIILSSWQRAKTKKLSIFSMAVSFLATLLTFSKGAAAALFVGLVFLFNG